MDHRQTTNMKRAVLSSKATTAPACASTLQPFFFIYCTIQPSQGLLKLKFGKFSLEGEKIQQPGTEYMYNEGSQMFYCFSATWPEKTCVAWLQFRCAHHNDSQANGRSISGTHHGFLLLCRGSGRALIFDHCLLCKLVACKVHCSERSNPKEARDRTLEQTKGALASKDGEDYHLHRHWCAWRGSHHPCFHHIKGSGDNCCKSSR